MRPRRFLTVIAAAAALLAAGCGDSNDDSNSPINEERPQSEDPRAPLDEDAGRGETDSEDEGGQD